MIMRNPKSHWCPNCGLKFEEFDYHGILIERCTVCLGIWLEGVTYGELEKNRGSHPIDIGTEEPDRSLTVVSKTSCSDCGKPMRRIFDKFKPRLHYEACPSHEGFFFDIGDSLDRGKDGLAEFFTKT